jgi:hypothetical protein
MAITFDTVESDATGVSGQSAATMKAFTLGGGSNRRVFIGTELEDPTPEFAVTHINIGASTDVATLVVQESTDAGGATFNRVELWDIVEANLPVAGDYDIGVHFADFIGNNDDIGIIVASYSDITQSSARSSSYAINNSSSTISDTLTVQPGDIMISVVGNGSGNAYTHGSGQTELADIAPFSSAFAMTHETATASESHTVTHYAAGEPGRHVMACASFAGMPAAVANSPYYSMYYARMVQEEL